VIALLTPDNPNPNPQVDIEDESDRPDGVREELARTFKMSHRLKKIREQRKGMEGWRSVRKSAVDTEYLPVTARLSVKGAPRDSSIRDTNQTPLLY